jgi:predicted oxidoreductase
MMVKDAVMLGAGVVGLVASAPWAHSSGLRVKPSEPEATSNINGLASTGSRKTTLSVRASALEPLDQ